MPLLITVLYGAAALFGAAFAVVELRMLVRFWKYREEIRARRADAATGSPTAAVPAAIGAPTDGAAPAGDWGQTWPGPNGAAPPSVTVQLPLYNERTSAERIIRAAAAQNYPKDRFDIQVLDDSTDETSTIVAAVVEELREAGVNIVHFRRAHRTGFKAGALAEGLRRSDATFVAVFDADFAPDPTFLSRLLVDSDVFDDERVAFVQARWSWSEAEESGWLGGTLALLLDRHFRVQKPVRDFVGNVTTFNGSAGVWRRAAIEDAGGWTPDTLTEDLDLSYRCALAGWKGRYVHDVHVFNELPGHMRAFKLQQRRWAKGNAQCFRKLTRRVMRAGAVVEDRWDEAFMLAGYAIHPLLLASLALWPWAVLYVDRTLFWILQGFMSLGMIAAAVSFWVTLRERESTWSFRSVGRVLTGLMVGMGLMVNNTVGQIQGMLFSGGEFLRTPKRASGGDLSQALGAATPYALPLHWTFFAELLVLAYCVAGAGILLYAGEGLWSMAMIFWAACLGLMLQQQVTARSA